SGAQTEIWVRIPVVPGINDSYNEMESISDFIAGLKHVSLVELMSFHHMGEGKYRSLGLEYRAKNLIPPSDKQITLLLKRFEGKGLNTRRG
ncbi:MAG: glycyl-radical enzyme activating protein, partial [Clostridiales bacterium]|nr:glycyl-radical enzyme activating protein [Clostridiales bacterium]